MNKPKRFERRTRRHCGREGCGHFVMFSDVGWVHIETKGRKFDHAPIPGDLPKEGE